MMKLRTCAWYLINMILLKCLWIFTWSICFCYKYLWICYSFTFFFCLNSGFFSYPQFLVSCRQWNTFCIVESKGEVQLETFLHSYLDFRKHLGTLFSLVSHVFPVSLLNQNYVSSSLVLGKKFISSRYYI